VRRFFFRAGRRAVTSPFFRMVLTAMPPTPVNQPPVAMVGADVTCGKAPLTVQFDGTSSYDPDLDDLSYSWDFGDGSGGTGASLEHVYTANGTYMSRLTVDDGQATASAQLDITVKNGKCKGGR
jgi:PKD repeat protein